MKNDDMKSYRKHELPQYVTGNLLLILIFSDRLNTILSFTDTDSVKILSALLGSGVVGSIIYVFVFILDSFVSYRVKDRIVYWWSPQPGESVFSDIRSKDNDERFTSEDAILKYSAIYANIDIIAISSSGNSKKQRHYENSEWYKIYKRNETNGSVFSSQRDFLLMRDICAITVSLTTIYILSSIAGLLQPDMRVFIMLGAEYLISKVSAILKARRFVFSVIACDLARETELTGRL